MSCFAVTATATRPHGKRATTRDRTQTTSSSHHGGTSSPIRGDDKKTKASVSLPGGKLHLGNDSWRRTAAGIAAGAYLSMTTAMALPAPAGATFLDDMQEPSIMGLTLKPRVQEVILESKSDHIGEDFSGLDLQGAIYAECDLRDSDFSHSDLRAIIFSRAIMPNVNFEGSDMQSAFLDYVVLRGANFRNVIATNANFTRSDLGDVDVTNADFTEAVVDRYQVRPCVGLSQIQDTVYVPSAIALCENASGTNPFTKVSTRESLGCDYLKKYEGSGGGGKITVTKGSGIWGGGK